MFASAGIVILAATASYAQDDVAALYGRAASAMEAKKWDEALKSLDEIVQRFGAIAKDEIGARFGSIYFSIGQCKTQKKDYKGAAEAFRKCYEEFPSTGSDPKDQNPYHLASLRQWANVERVGKDFKKAAELYEKFLASKPEPGSFNKAELLVGLGDCYLELNRADEAQKAAMRIFDDPKRMGATPEQRFLAFRVLARGWISTGKAAAPKADAFLKANPDVLKFGDWKITKSGIGGSLVQLAADATREDLPAFAIQLLQYVPTTEDIVRDLRGRASGKGKISPKLQAEMDLFTKRLDDGKALDERALIGLSKAYAKLGSNRASYVLHDRLKNDYPKSQFGEQILYGLTAKASDTGETEVAQHYGKKFLERYPASDFKSGITSVILGRLFADRKYEKAYDLAKETRAALKRGAPERELADFVVATSLYYLGRFDEATTELSAFLKAYPKGKDSKYYETVQYHQAANLVKLNRWEKAAEKLDLFLKEYPESDSKASAYLDRATCYYAGEKDYDRALETVGSLKKEFPATVVMGEALLLEGDLRQYKGQAGEATKVYLAAKEWASQNAGGAGVKARALIQLITIAADEKHAKDAVGYYQEYSSEFAGSQGEGIAVVAAFPALVAEGKADLGFKRLEEMIIILGSDPDSPDLERMINTYAKHYSEQKGPAELVERLRNFPGVSSTNKPLVAWLTIAQIDVLEASANRDKFKNRKAQLQVLYNELQSMPRKQLSNYIVWKVGQNLVEKEDPAQARPWFETVLASSQPEFKDRATLGMAIVVAGSKDKETKRSAIGMFQRVLKEFKSPDLKKDATLGIGRVYYNLGEYQNAIDKAFKPYKDNKKWTSDRREIIFKLGRCYEETGQVERALINYLNVVVNYKGYLEYSAESWYRAAQIQYNKNDKQKAYEMMNQMVEQMGVHIGHEDDKGGYIRKATNTRDRWASEIGSAPASPEAPAPQ